MANIVLLTNEMTPYRKSFYDKLYQNFTSNGHSFKVLTMTRLQKGYNWNFDEVMAHYVHLMKGIHLSRPVSMHINLEVYHQIKKLKPDVLIIAGSYMHPTAWIALSAIDKTKTTTFFWSESHLNEFRNYNKISLKVRDIIRKTFYHKFDGFWFAGKMSKNLIDKYSSVDSIKIFTPNLIDNNKYSEVSTSLADKKHVLIKKWGLNENKRIAIIPARLSVVKGIHKFIELLSKCRYKDNLQIIIPGTGPYENTIRQYIEKYKVNVELLGYQQQNDMIELYSLSDMFILPSLSDPNPLTCVEALWCGLPLLVSTHVGNYPEVIKEGVNGYVFDYSKEDESVEIIDTYINNSPEWYKEASIYSKNIADNLYNPDKVVESLCNKMISSIKA